MCKSTIDTSTTNCKCDSGEVSGKPAVCQLPEMAKRAETGTIQFGNDWPGVFVRGDHAFYFACEIALALGSIERGEPVSEIQISSLRGLQELLGSCNIHGR